MKLQWVRFHLGDSIAVEDSNWSKQGPSLCCKGTGSCEEHRCPVHFCITSLLSWQGFQHTGVGALEESEENEVPLPTSISRHGAFSKCSKLHTNSPFCTQFSLAVLGCMPSPPTSQHRHQVAIGTHFHQDRFTDEKKAVKLQHPYTWKAEFTLHPSHEKASAPHPTALVWFNAAALVLAALSACGQTWDF